MNFSQAIITMGALVSVIVGVMGIVRTEKPWSWKMTVIVITLIIVIVLATLISCATNNYCPSIFPESN